MGWLTACKVRRTWLAAVVVAVVGATVATVGCRDSDGDQLRWASPSLRDPVVLHVRQGMNHLQLSNSRDYVVVVPRPRLLGTLWLEGGHNVEVIGGHVTVPATANQLDNGADNTDTGIYVEGATGVVHLEGLLVDAMPFVMFDAIDVNAPHATVQIERVRVNGLWGSDRTEHADAVQTWGGVGTLRIYEMTVVGDYQGLTINPDLGPVGQEEIDKADLTLEPVPLRLRAISVGGGHMIWLTQGVYSCASGRIRLSQVYIDDRTPRTVPNDDTEWPQRDSSLPCRAHVSKGRATWPRLPVKGSVTLSAPPDGAFVPSQFVGANYRRSTFSAR